MVLSAHLCQVLQPWRWYGSGFSGTVCLNRPYVVGSFLGQIGSLSAWRVWYTVPKAASYAVLSYLWKKTSRVTRVTLVLWIGNETLRLLPSFSRFRKDSFRQRNLRSGWRVRQYDLTTSLRQRRRRAISQWIGVILYGFKTRSRGGVPKRQATQCLVPYSENKGYASSPRSFVVLLFLF